MFSSIESFVSFWFFFSSSAETYHHSWKPPDTPVKWLQSDLKFHLHSDHHQYNHNYYYYSGRITFRRLFGETRLLPESATMQLPELANRVKQFQRNIRSHVGHNGFESEWGGGGAQVYSHSEEACREQSMSHRQSCQIRFLLIQFEITI